MSQSGQVSLDRSFHDARTRVGMILGSTTRNGGEFDFRKITLSLERDLVPAENPIDAYRDIKALLERMVKEFQGPAAVKSQQTSGVTPTSSTSKPAGLTLEMLRERLAGWLADLEIMQGLDGFAVKPKRYLGETWENVNAEIRALGGKWIRGSKPADGAWRIPK